MRNRYAFVGGSYGKWRTTRVQLVRGDALAYVPCVDVAPVDAMPCGRSAAWLLTGQISNLRYATRGELTALRARQDPLGRPLASRAALIPIKKTSEWWDLAQDERRAIFEEQSRHTAIGLEYLPGVARQLYHCRDLGEPFDFLTWFEYAPEHADAFEQLVDRLRSTREWAFVEREVDIRLEFAGSAV
jgi:hypothetical protein